MLILGDMVMDHGSYARQRTSISTSSSTRNSRAVDTAAAEERERQRDEAVQNLMQMK
jgi:hypothetical protein